MEDYCFMGQDRLRPSPPLFSTLTGQTAEYPLLKLPAATDLPPETELSPEPFGFMELLGNQGFESLSSVLDGVMSSNVPSASSGFLEASEVLNPPPGTPNSSSISSGFNEEVKVENLEEEDQEQAQKKTAKQLKPKKKSQKKQKEARFAFMTKSQVDHLEDGYRWRKYGQKAVKDSPFPRSYYRCTSASCNVKKRVERSFNDPSMVMTTYEGQHNHPSSITARGGGVGGGFLTGFLPNIGFSGGAAAIPTSPCTLPLQMGNGYFPYINFNQGSLARASYGQVRRLCNPADGLGLLQDIMPTNVYDAQ